MTEETKELIFVCAVVFVGLVLVFIEYFYKR